MLKWTVLVRARCYYGLELHHSHNNTSYERKNERKKQKKITIRRRSGIECLFSARVHVLKYISKWNRNYSSYLFTYAKSKTVPNEISFVFRLIISFSRTSSLPLPSVIHLPLPLYLSLLREMFHHYCSRFLALHFLFLITALLQISFSHMFTVSVLTFLNMHAHPPPSFPHSPSIRHLPIFVHSE